MYSLFGDSDFTARLAPALMGTAMVAMPYFLRRQLGRVAAFTAAVLLAIGPTYLYFSRFAREDIYFAAISFALLVVVFRFLDAPRRWHPALIGALIALGFATKETMYIAGFVAFTFFAILLLREGRGGPTRAALRSVGWEAWVWALAAFAATFTLMFTVFLTNPSGLWDGLYESIAYWIGQHDVGRGGEKPYFYVVGAARRGVAGACCSARSGRSSAFRQPTVLRAFLVWAFALSLAIYSWAGEKFAWLVLHPLLPLILLAGLGVQWLWEARGTRRGQAALVVAAVAAIYVPVASWWVNVEHRADPRELLVSTQSSEAVKRVADEVSALARKQPEAVGDDRLGRRRDVPLRVVLPPSQRRLPRPHHASPAPPASDVLVMTEASSQRLAPQLAAYRSRRFPFRVWWVRDYAKRHAGGLAALDLRAQGLEPHGGHARVPLRAPELTRLASGRRQRSRHTVVPPRSNTRRPSVSHFGRPASPWSARSIGPTTT